MENMTDVAMEMATDNRDERGRGRELEMTEDAREMKVDSARCSRCHTCLKNVTSGLQPA